MINKKWFSIIEVLVWIFVFSLWIASIYAIISSTLRINNYNENYIIASNLALEQVELVRNIRDSNYMEIKKFNQINPWDNNYSNLFEIWKKYTIENDYSNSSVFPIKVEDISAWFEEWVNSLNSSSMQSYNLCLDDKNRYTFDCSWNTKTKFYKYISIEKVSYNWSWWETQIDESFLVRSKVIWYMNWYHEFELKSIITDWKRL